MVDRGDGIVYSTVVAAGVKNSWDEGLETPSWDALTENRVLFGGKLAGGARPGATRVKSES
jgi:hypothetical protein|eukprot:4159296-Prymnesium_polylepis.1